MKSIQMVYDSIQNHLKEKNPNPQENSQLQNIPINTEPNTQIWNELYKTILII